MGIVDAGKVIHHPWDLVENESLDGKFDINTEVVFDGQELNRMVFSRLENAFVSSDQSSRDSSGTLIYLCVVSISCQVPTPGYIPNRSTTNRIVPTEMGTSLILEQESSAAA